MEHVSRRSGHSHIVPGKDNADTNGSRAKAILAPFDLRLADGHDVWLSDTLAIPGVGHRVWILPNRGKGPQTSKGRQVIAVNWCHADSCRWRLCRSPYSAEDHSTFTATVRVAFYCRTSSSNA